MQEGESAEGKRKQDGKFLAEVYLCQNRTSGSHFFTGSFYITFYIYTTNAHYT